MRQSDLSLRTTRTGLLFSYGSCPRCEGLDDEKLLADVAEYGWHVLKIFEKNETPSWAFSIGLYLAGRREVYTPPVIERFSVKVMYLLKNAPGMPPINAYRSKYE